MHFTSCERTLRTSMRSSAVRALPRLRRGSCSTSLSTRPSTTATSRPLWSTSASWLAGAVMVMTLLNASSSALHSTLTPGHGQNPAVCTAAGRCSARQRRSCRTASSRRPSSPRRWRRSTTTSAISTAWRRAAARRRASTTRWGTAQLTDGRRCFGRSCRMNWQGTCASLTAVRCKPLLTGHHGHESRHDGGAQGPSLHEQQATVSSRRRCVSTCSSSWS